MAQEQFRPGFSLAGAVDLESLKHKVDAEPGTEGGAPAAGGYVIDATEQMFNSLVQNSATYPILLFMWVPTDNRLFPLATKLGDAVNAMNGQLQMARIDISQAPQIMQAFQLQGAPALFALIGGRPMPIIAGMPSEEETQQIIDTVLPQLVQLAAQAGVTGSAPYMGGAEGANNAGAEDGAEDAEAAEPAIPAAHEEAHRLAMEGDYAGAAAAYEQVLESDPNDTLAARERAKALLLARSANADVREVREAAAANPDDVNAQLAVADIDMIGGQIQDAFDRLLDFVAAGHKSEIEPVRQRLLEYFLIPDATDERLNRARRRLATLMY
ncbi:tetratricopeptide repeat protein [Bifidobacterium magnum]|uniref:Thioredoxin-like protein n=1 Tax=Bifidobacterium magnum TaxID=1692 RepID=A0A087BEW4_9BIFI|nr:tetratricopeptide repeat protein [Bifidobacterium magnum]KFI69564.1 Thioredoxin-like protein [Bifidobacterium magnum]